MRRRPKVVSKAAADFVRELKINLTCLTFTFYNCYHSNTSGTTLCPTTLFLRWMASGILSFSAATRLGTHEAGGCCCCLAVGSASSCLATTQWQSQKTSKTNQESLLLYELVVPLSVILEPKSWAFEISSKDLIRKFLIFIDRFFQIRKFLSPSTRELQFLSKSKTNISTWV